MPRTSEVVAVLLFAGFAALDAKVLIRGIPTQQVRPDSKATVASPRRDGLVVRVVDTSGSPIAGARIGRGAYASTQDSRSGWQFLVPRAESDANGSAELVGVIGLEREKKLLYVLQDHLGLVGFKEISKNDLRATVTVTLEPACHVRGRLMSSGLAELKRPIGWTNAYIYRGAHRPLSFSSQSQEYHFYLPPGIYNLSAYGTDLETVETQVEVKKGMRDLELRPIDLPPTKVAMLLGRPAPDLQRITAWKNGGPVGLADLRGKIVVLDFWGYWCGPCLRELPALMAAHDDFAESGLVVIAVHDNSVKSIAELDERIASVRRTQWFGRDLPFLVALDGDGATTAAFGITSFPTSLLIDREGKVARRLDSFRGRPDDVEAAISQLLGVAGKRPSWQDRFAEVYRLGPGEVLRFVRPPVIPERAKFITREFSAQGSGGPADVSLVLPSNGTVRPQSPVDPSLLSLLRGIAADSKRQLPHKSAFEFAAGLDRVTLPGDWIFREGTTVEARFEALERVLIRELRRPIRCERRQMKRDVVLVSGHYLPRPVSKERPEVHLSADNRDLDSEIGGGEGTLDELLSALATITGLRFVDEATISKGAKIRWVQHDSTLERGRHAALIANVSKQTSLQFQRTERLVEVWFVTEQ